MFRGKRKFIHLYNVTEPNMARPGGRGKVHFRVDVFKSRSRKAARKKARKERRRIEEAGKHKYVYVELVLLAELGKKIQGHIFCS